MNIFPRADFEKAGDVSCRFEALIEPLTADSGGAFNPTMIVVGKHVNSHGGIFVGSGVNVHIYHKALGLTFGCGRADGEISADSLYRADDRKEFESCVSRLGALLHMNVYLNHDTTDIRTMRGTLHGIESPWGGPYEEVIGKNRFVRLKAVLATEESAAMNTAEADGIVAGVSTQYRQHRAEVLELLSKLKEINDTAKAEYRKAIQEAEQLRKSTEAEQAAEWTRNQETARRLGFTYGTTAYSFELWFGKRCDYFFSREALASVPARRDETKNITDLFELLLTTHGGVTPLKIEVHVPVNGEPDSDTYLEPADTTHGIVSSAETVVKVKLDKAGWDRLARLEDKEAATLRRAIRSVDLPNSISAPPLGA